MPSYVSRLPELTDLATEQYYGTQIVCSPLPEIHGHTNRLVAGRDARQRRRAHLSRVNDTVPF